LRRRRLFACDAEVDLAAWVRVEVERLALDKARECVRASGDGLRLQYLCRPGVRHLSRDDSLEVALERGDVDDAQELSLRDDLELASVEPPVEPEHSLLRRAQNERLHGGHRAGLGRELQVSAQRQRALRELERRARRIGCDERQRRGDRHGTATLGE
jgi:hypothetical protein